MRVDSDTDIDGTPTVTGTFSLVAIASQFDIAAPFDSGYQILPRSLADITPSGPSCPAITITGSLPGGIVGTPYSQPLAASGGTAPYTFSILTGALPAGLQLSSRRRRLRHADAGGHVRPSPCSRPPPAAAPAPPPSRSPSPAS